MYTGEGAGCVLLIIGVGADLGGDHGCGADTSTVCCGCWKPFDRGDFCISLDELKPLLVAFGIGGGGAAPKKVELESVQARKTNRYY